MYRNKKGQFITKDKHIQNYNNSIFVAKYMVIATVIGITMMLSHAVVMTLLDYIIK